MGDGCDQGVFVKDGGEELEWVLVKEKKERKKKKGKKGVHFPKPQINY